MKHKIALSLSLFALTACTTNTTKKNPSADTAIQIVNQLKAQKIPVTYPADSCPECFRIYTADMKHVPVSNTKIYTLATYDNSSEKTCRVCILSANQHDN